MVIESKLLVSVIALCYNQEKFIISTLDSIINQDYANIELIIIDNGSQDNSLKVINNWIRINEAKCKLISYHKNVGISAALNNALKCANGDLIQLISCDDVLLPQKISTQVPILLANSNACLVYSDADLIDDNGENFNTRFIQKHGIGINIPSGDIIPWLIKRNFIPAPSCLIRKKALIDVGLFDEGLIYEDYDMLLRLASRFEFIFSPACLTKYRIHNTNAHSLLSNRLEVDKLHVLSKHIGKLDDAEYNFVSQIVYIYKTNPSVLMKGQLKIGGLSLIDYNIGKLLRFCLKRGVGYRHYNFIQQTIKYIRG